jgi:hypothetical protein
LRLLGGQQARLIQLADPGFPFAASAAAAALPPGLPALVDSIIFLDWATRYSLETS